MSKIKAVIEKNIESQQPQFKLLEWLKANAEAKLLNEPLLKKMQEATGDYSLRIARSAGMTHVLWGFIKGGSLIVAHTEMRVHIDTKFIERENPSYFSALLKRNEIRRKALADEKAIEELEQTLEIFVAAREKLEKLMGHGTIFDQDRYHIEKEYGIHD